MLSVIINRRCFLLLIKKRSGEKKMIVYKPPNHMLPPHVKFVKLKVCNFFIGLCTCIQVVKHVYGSSMPAGELQTVRWADMGKFIN